MCINIDSTCTSHCISMTFCMTRAPGTLCSAATCCHVSYRSRRQGEGRGIPGETQGFTVSAGEILPEVKVRLTGPPQKNHEIRILETILVSSRV